MDSQITLLYILLLGVFTKEALSQNQASFKNGDYTVSWTHLQATSEIEFTVQAKTQGWVALGISAQNSDMTNIDLFVGGVQNSAGYLKVCF